MRKQPSRRVSCLLHLFFHFTIGPHVLFTKYRGYLPVVFYGACGSQVDHELAVELITAALSSCTKVVAC